MCGCTTSRLPRFPATPYDEVARAAAKHWQQADAEYGLPFHPNVTMGWDSSPRTVQSDVYENTGYPFGPVLRGEHAGAVQGGACSRRRRFWMGGQGPKILSINAWNEWTEGSYLEPDTVEGMAYLEAVHGVSGR